MSKPSDNPADPFKKALAEATKVMADDPELSVNYTVDPSGVSGDIMRLPQVSRRMTRDEVLLARGTADALALQRKYHDEGVHARYAPPGDMARDLYEAMETARCEAMGARDMPGTASNIDVKIANEMGVEIRDVASKSVLKNGVLKLTVSGNIVNVTGTERPVPRISIQLVDKNGQHVYSWSAAADQERVEPWGTVTFSSSMNQPPEDAKHVRVDAIVPPKPDNKKDQ